jgi:DNA modification methylase
MELNTIYNEDCLITMSKMPNNFVDLVITSPPYDTLRDYKGYSFDFKKIAQELYRVVKEGGVIVWIVNDAVIKGSETGTSFKQALYFKEIGFNIHDTMIWSKKNPMPQVKTKRYFSKFEYMFVFSKGIPKTFNPIMIKTKMGGEVYNSTVKQISQDKVRVEKTFVLNEERVKDNIWEIAIAQNKTSHPAVFPEQLAYDHIISWSNKSDIVYDPFLGSGTTAKVCKELFRNYIGSEIAEDYYNIAIKRLKDTNESLDLF